MRSNTIIIVLSALAATLTTAIPIGSGNGEDAYTGASGNARGGDVILEIVSGKIAQPTPDNKAALAYTDGKMITTGNGGMSSTGDAHGAPGGVRYRQRDGINLGIDLSKGLDGQRIVKRLLDGGINEGFNNGNVLDGLLGGLGGQGLQKRLLDGGINEGDNNDGVLNGLLGGLGSPGMQKRLLDGGINEGDNNGGVLNSLLGGLGMQKRVLDGTDDEGDNNEGVANGILGGLLHRDEHKRLLDGVFNEGDNNGGVLNGLLGLKRDENKRLLDVGADLDNVLKIRAQDDMFSNIAGDFEKALPVFKQGLAGGSGSSTITTGNGGNTTSGDAFGGLGLDGNGGNAYSGSSGDASAGSVIIEETIKAPMKARDSEDEEPEMKEAMVIKPQDRLKAMGAQALAGAAPIFGTQ